MSARVAALCAALCVAVAQGFRAPQPVKSRHVARRQAIVTMKTWSKRKTLADETGGTTDLGAASVGLIGTIPVEFTQGETVLKTMAIPGQPLSAVAAQAGQCIKYKCRKGECGTCQVQLDGKWVKTCQTNVRPPEFGDVVKVQVRQGAVKAKKTSRFFSLSSFRDGFWNNLLGMVGFVREGRRCNKEYQQRITEEARIREMALAKRRALEASAVAESP